MSPAEVVDGVDVLSRVCLRVSESKPRLSVKHMPTGPNDQLPVSRWLDATCLCQPYQQRRQHPNGLAILSPGRCDVKSRALVLRSALCPQGVSWISEAAPKLMKSDNTNSTFIQSRQNRVEFWRGGSCPYCLSCKGLDAQHRQACPCRRIRALWYRKAVFGSYRANRRSRRRRRGRGHCSSNMQLLGHMCPKSRPCRTSFSNPQLSYKSLGSSAGYDACRVRARDERRFRSNRCGTVQC